MPCYDPTPDAQKTALEGLMCDVLRFNEGLNQMEALYASLSPEGAEFLRRWLSRHRERESKWGAKQHPKIEEWLLP